MNPAARFVVEGNIIEGMPNFSRWFSKPVEMASTPAAAPPVTLADVKLLLSTVLAQAGATVPKRDAVDRRVAAGVASGTGRIIDSQKEVGGWPEYASSPAKADTDGDGIPDAWEKQHKLNPADPADGPRAASGGYTNLELYLNSLPAAGSTKTAVP